jgi:hypothetical protein
MNSLEKLILGGEEESVDQQCFINHDFHYQRFSFRQYIPARIAALGNMRSVPNFGNNANRRWSIFQRPLLSFFLLRLIAGAIFLFNFNSPLGPDENWKAAWNGGPGKWTWHRRNDSRSPHNLICKIWRTTISPSTGEIHFPEHTLDIAG